MAEVVDSKCPLETSCASWLSLPGLIAPALWIRIDRDTMPWSRKRGQTRAPPRAKLGQDASTPRTSGGALRITLGDHDHLGQRARLGLAYWFILHRWDTPGHRRSNRRCAETGITAGHVWRVAHKRHAGLGGGGSRYPGTRSVNTPAPDADGPRLTDWGCHDATYACHE